jgi:quercetin dioxygenase-like cupin family protein
MSKNRLHHHSHQDHVLYVVRGRGTAKLENATGQVETRMIEPGDILSLPRGKKHGFEKSGNEDLVFLVVATPLPPGVEETTYHE